ncbi:MAG: hypothetical protein KDN05_03515 [Verrucomicrobiae bacterium]|nr:hypothetical protein [Verrucomicrobiae bacterium]MCP5532270.1 hypothetical protein [Akkermansiaceae bacterium]MCP5542959.1 hypothetical protein [Akkermansiaceae bacterium]MCP5547749.1 hypothetical protein [Akkermansiaceae bacterium]
MNPNTTIERTKTYLFETHTVLTGLIWCGSDTYEAENYDKIEAAEEWINDIENQLFAGGLESLDPTAGKMIESAILAKLTPEEFAGVLTGFAAPSIDSNPRTPRFYSYFHDREILGEWLPPITR